MLGPYQKLVKIGLLVNGFAHDLNNALTGIMGNLELYKMNLPPEVEDNKHLNRLGFFAERIYQLTRDILTCGRKGKPDLQPTDLNGIINQHMPYLTAGLTPSVQVKLDLGDDLPKVMADASQIAFALSALWQNAVEAVGEKGVITITTRNLEINDDGKTVTPRPGNYVSLIFSDDGPGMDQKTKENLFNPLFSTKPEGDGMGMAVVQAIVQNHIGWIKVDSAPGDGTTVNISLPVE